MAAAGARLFLGSSPPLSRREISTSFGISRRANHRHSTLALPSYAVTEKAIPITETSSTSFRENGSLRKGKIEVPASREVETAESDESAEVGKSMKDFFEESRELIRSDGGPPRWFSPLECGSQRRGSPLLLYVPGIDGTGLGLIMQHHRLGKIFDIWCMHIPVDDRTPFSGLVTLVERTIRSENKRSPNQPIYLVGESLGGCIALEVAARNPDIDLVLVLANPATSYGKSQLQLLLPFMETLSEQFSQNLPDILSSITGQNQLRTSLDSFLKELPLPQAVQELSNKILAGSPYLPVLADMLPKGTLQWKLQMLNVASLSANSHLHAVKAQTLVLCSGMDQLLPSQEEGQRLQHSLSGCKIRRFQGKGHFLFLEPDVDLVTVLIGTSIYRRGKFHDYVSDYVPPTHSEFKKLYDSSRLVFDITSPVMLSTLENGKLVKGLSGIPSEGPVLYVGYHMSGSLDVIALVGQFFKERNIVLRGIAHPMNFLSKESLSDDQGDSLIFDLLPDPAAFDANRVMGSVPVSGANFYKLLSSKSHVLLYPGGLRETLHRKGEEYKLFWPERSEFVRMAARFGAKIVPFGTVGEDDLFKLVLDYDDQIRIPFIKSQLEALNEKIVSLRDPSELILTLCYLAMILANVRTDADGEVANQHLHFPLSLPKVPGRIYIYFSKPIATEGRKQELRNKEKAHELYLQLRSEVERCIAFLKEKREQDPYRKLLPRLLYQASNGLTDEVPTFEL